MIEQLMGLTQDQTVTVVLSVICAILGLLAHNVVHVLMNEDADFAFTLPTIEKGKLKLGGALTAILAAGVVGFFLMDPVAAFFACYASTNLMKDAMALLEKRGLIDKPLIP